MSRTVDWKDIEELTAKIRKQNDRIMRLIYVAYAEMAAFLILILLGG